MTMDELKPIDFWAIKHQIDDEVKRLGWSKNQCREYVKTHYNKSTRLAMSDAQLLHLLSRLMLMDDLNTESKTVVKSRRRDRRRRR